MVPERKDFGRTCRTCLDVPEDLQSIYDCTKEYDMTVIEILELVVPNLNWKTGDEELPTTLCSCCLRKLLKFYKFQCLCSESDQRLRDVLEEETDTKAEIKLFESSVLDEEEDVLVEQQDENQNEWLEFIDLHDGHAEDHETTMDKPIEVYLEMKIDADTLKISKKAQATAKQDPKAETEASSNVRKEFKCKQCDKIFKKAYGLNRHQSVHERSTSKKLKMNTARQYVCEYCNKAFQQSCSLKDHVRTHTGEQPYLCSECGKAFTSASNMRQHLLRHTGFKRYECPECPKKFACLSDLASHKSIHKKIKPHCCEICGATFGKPFLLKKHMMYHNNEKPHKCEYCEKRFVCADHMRRHARTHTGEKPYKCKYCPRAFAQSNDLMKHLRSHVGDNLYRCELCPRGFRLAAELREHFTKHKNESDETRANNLKALHEMEAQLKLSLPTFNSEQLKEQEQTN